MCLDLDLLLELDHGVELGVVLCLGTLLQLASRCGIAAATHSSGSITRLVLRHGSHLF